MQGLRSPRGVASPPAYTVPPVSRANPAGDVGLQGLRSARWARSTACASLCRSRSGACPTWVRGLCRGCARPLGSLHRLPTLCHPFHGLIPQVMLGCRGCARPLGSLHRLPTLCRPFHGLIPRVMLGCRGFARPLGSLHRLPTLCRPFHGLKLCLCPWWRGGEDTLKIFFRVIYC